MDTLDPVDALFARAKAARVPMATICDRAGIASTTPSRWKRKKNGATLDRVNRLADALNDILAEQEAA